MGTINFAEFRALNERQCLQIVKKIKDKQIVGANAVKKDCSFILQKADFLRAIPAPSVFYAQLVDDPMCEQFLKLQFSTSVPYDEMWKKLRVNFPSPSRSPSLKRRSLVRSPSPSRSPSPKRRSLVRSPSLSRAPSPKRRSLVRSLSPPASSLPITDEGISDHLPLPEDPQQTPPQSEEPTNPEQTQPQQSEEPTDSDQPQQSEEPKNDSTPPKKTTGRKKKDSKFPSKKGAASQQKLAIKFCESKLDVLCLANTFQIPDFDLATNVLNCHHGINLIHISDCSDAYQTWFEKLMIKDIIPANSLLMIECWNISNISFISSQVAAADELCIAGIFTPSTPLIRHFALQLFDGFFMGFCDVCLKKCEKVEK